MLTIAFMACLVLLTVGFLVLMDRRDRRAHEERAAHRTELQALLQRIQAPEAAVVQHQVAAVTDAPQPPGTDDEFWKLTDEHAHAIAELEARENALVGR